MDGPLQRAFAQTIDAKVQAQLSVVREGIGQAFRAIRVDEPDHRVSPSMALSLSMALHDLCTNTAKDGAMSVPDGRVRITWATPDTAAGPSLVMRREERGGPPVALHPARASDRGSFRTDWPGSSMATCA